MAKSLAEELKITHSATIVYHLYDISVYFSSSAVGELTLPKRAADGKFHVSGELALVDWPAFKKIFNISVPLLRAGGENKKLLLSPLPRYFNRKCCVSEST